MEINFIYILFLSSIGFIISFYYWKLNLQLGLYYQKFIGTQISQEGVIPIAVLKLESICVYKETLF